MGSEGLVCKRRIKARTRELLTRSSGNDALETKPGIVTELSVQRRVPFKQSRDAARARPHHLAGDTHERSQGSSRSRRPPSRKGSPPPQEGRRALRRRRSRKGQPSCPSRPRSWLARRPFGERSGQGPRRTPRPSRVNCALGFVRTR